MIRIRAPWGGRVLFRGPEGHDRLTAFRRDRQREKENPMMIQKPFEKLKAERVELLLSSLPGWALDAERKSLTLQVRFLSPRESLSFLRQVCQVAANRRHQLDVALDQGAVTVKLGTSEMGGLSEEDFRFARLVNRKV